MKSIIWLASYPKSGNTWLRVFLANYVLNGDQPVKINEIGQIGTSDTKASRYVAVFKGDFDGNDPVKTAQLRPAVLKSIVSNRADINFVKTHCLNGVAYGIRLIPPELTKSAIYIVRNPLDMAVSFASHYNLTIDRAINSISDINNSLKAGASNSNAYQFLGNWSDHVRGWTNVTEFPVLFIRYEDMLLAPMHVFNRVVDHIGLPVDPTRLEKAIKFSSFDTLKAQESKVKFIENSNYQDRFFRSGSSNQWKTKLTKRQVDAVLKAHGAVMKKHGYEV